MTAEDKADVEAYPFREDDERKQMGAYAAVGEDGFSTLERRSAPLQQLLISVHVLQQAWLAQHDWMSMAQRPARCDRDSCMQGVQLVKQCNLIHNACMTGQCFNPAERLLLRAPHSL